MAYKSNPNQRILFFMSTVSEMMKQSSHSGLPDTSTDVPSKYAAYDKFIYMYWFASVCIVAVDASW